MVSVLVLSSCYPHRLSPNAGIFVEKQTLALASRPDVRVGVIAPILSAPFPFDALAKNRRQVPLAGPEETARFVVHRPRVPVLSRPASSVPVLMALRLLPLLASLRRSSRFDVLAAEWFWPDGVAAMLLAGLLRVPFTVKARGRDFETPARWSRARELVRRTLERADALFAVSESLRSQMIEAGADGRKTHRHYTGIDHSLFHPRDKGAAKASLGLEGPVLLCVAGLNPRKGHVTLLEALRHLSDATLLLAGGGGERARLEAEARALGTADRVRFLGSVPQQQLPRLYAAADLTVMATRGEGLANAWLESLACGRPVVTTDVGGAREVIRGPEAGRLVARDPEAIAQGVRALLADLPSPQRTRAFAEGFTWERNASELAHHLETLAQ